MEPKYQLPPSTGPTYSFQVSTGDVATEVFVIDSNYERVARAVGDLTTFNLPGGLYKVKVKSGDHIQEQLINLKENHAKSLIFSPAAFDSPIPLGNTGKSHEYHEENALEHSKEVNKSLGSGSELYVFVRDWTKSGPVLDNPLEQPALGLTIRNEAGTELANVNADEFPESRENDPWKACNLELEPGNYRLRLQKADGTYLEQTITTCRGWQTQVFLLLKQYSNGPDSRRADLANGAVYMTRIGQWLDASQIPSARLTDLARQGLVNRRSVLTDLTLTDLLNGKFENPMLGILGGHLLLLQTNFDVDLLRDIVQNLRRMLGNDHPDVEALAIRAFGGTDYRFNAPPMLFSSWRILLDTSIKQPDIIPADSLAQAVAYRMWSGAPWLLWTPYESIRPAEKRACQQEIRQQLKLNATPYSYGPPPDALESVMADRGVEPVASSASLTEEQVGHLVRTMGLPRGQIEKLYQKKTKMNALISLPLSDGISNMVTSEPLTTQVIANANGLPLRITVRMLIEPTLPLALAPIAPEAPLILEAEIEAPPINYSNRKGYDPQFLGPGKAVPLPQLSAILMRDAAKLTNATTASAIELKYTHFSVVQNRQRKMPFLTAVNIDGRKLRRIPRGDNWIKDSRIASNAQFGNELYSHNDLDRGHMVRRLDPVWGNTAEATLANDDTFHFTNSCPQHKNLNQKTWADLEDYILDNADARNLKVTVFTGPVFRADDKSYRTARIPREFWKVAVLVDDQTGELSATAYLLSQAGMIQDLEFAFGAFRTFQISIAEVETLTDLDFGKLSDFDPIGTTESVGGPHVIERPQDIRFR